MPDQPRSGIILVVDDQENVRALLRRQLTDYGHTVLEAGDGAEALHLVRRRNGAVDLILSDLVMPQMNGTELASRIGGEFPGVPVILMSAFAPAGVARVGLSESIVPVLQKPFDAVQLGELVALALEHPVSPRAGVPAL
jgi:two-component system cell cycle sensor histidine kinase/response regulator CckA